MAFLSSRAELSCVLSSPPSPRTPTLISKHKSVCLQPVYLCFRFENLSLISPGSMSFLASPLPFPSLSVFQSVGLGGLVDKRAGRVRKVPGQQGSTAKEWQMITGASCAVHLRGRFQPLDRLLFPLFPSPPTKVHCSCFGELRAYKVRCPVTSAPTHTFISKPRTFDYEPLPSTCSS